MINKLTRFWPWLHRCSVTRRGRFPFVAGLSQWFRRDLQIRIGSQGACLVALAEEPILSIHVPWVGLPRAFRHRAASFAIYLAMTSKGKRMHGRWLFLSLPSFFNAPAEIQRGTTYRLVRACHSRDPSSSMQVPGPRNGSQPRRRSCARSLQR